MLCYVIYLRIGIQPLWDLDLRTTLTSWCISCPKCSSCSIFKTSLMSKSIIGKLWIKSSSAVWMRLPEHCLTSRSVNMSKYPIGSGDHSESHRDIMQLLMHMYCSRSSISWWKRPRKRTWLQLSILSKALMKITLMKKSRKKRRRPRRKEMRRRSHLRVPRVAIDNPNTMTLNPSSNGRPSRNKINQSQQWPSRQSQRKSRSKRRSHQYNPSIRQPSHGSSLIREWFISKSELW